MKLLALLRTFESARPFSEEEAWFLFKLGAIAEACGWAMLLTGMGLQRYMLHGNPAPVLIAGQIHGILFLLYALAGLGLYPCLGWRRGKALIATLASVPPFGSLLFEQWASRVRGRQHLQMYGTYLVWVTLTEKSY